MIDTSPGWIMIPGERSREDAEGHNHGVLSFEDVVVNSSNVGAVKIGLASRRRAHERGTCTASGSAKRSRPTCADRAPASFGRPTKFNDSALASMSMGYQVSVTPLQMATAVSAVANGGMLVRAACGARASSATAVARRCAEGAAPGHHARDGRDDDVHHGRCRAARAPARRRSWPSYHGRGQDRHGREARRPRVLRDGLQRVLCRLRAVAPPGADHRRCRRHAHTAAATSAATSRRRFSSASPSAALASCACRRRRQVLPVIMAADAQTVLASRPPHRGTGSGARRRRAASRACPTCAVSRSRCRPDPRRGRLVVPLDGIRPCDRPDARAGDPIEPAGVEHRQLGSGAPVHRRHGAAR